MTDKERIKDKLKIWRSNAGKYSKDLLKIVDKDTKEVTFQLNTAQEYMDKEVQDQLKRKGWVRKLVLKGRQQGASKYFTARNLRNTTMFTNINSFVMAHDGKTTDSLFTDYKNLYESIPNNPVVKPAKKKSNAKELEFDDIGSKVRIGTAGSVEVGRGFTVNRFHGSEVAFWENGDKILAGILQAIPYSKGTEIILESTANGMGNKFYHMCMDAMKGLGKFELIFIPWWWSSEYAMDEEEDFEPTGEEWEYYDTYMAKDCPDEQEAMRKLEWRRAKVIELGEKKFKQEYPSNPLEAFQMSGQNLFRSEWVECACNTSLKEDKTLPLLIGVDAAEAGGDRTAIVYRRGNKVTKIVTYDEMDEMRLAGIMADIIRISKPKYVNFDKAYAGGCVGRLKELGYGDIVKAVAFASKPIEPDRFLNKRAEMHWMLKEWLEEGYLEYDPDTGCGGVDLPDDYALRADLGCMPEAPPQANGKIKMVSKDKIREEFGSSPDILDALILTFAQPVHMVSNQERITAKTDLASKKIFGKRR